MPVEMRWVGIECGIAGQSNPLALVFGQRLLVGAVFGKKAQSDLHGVVLLDRPEPIVKEPMGVLAEGYPIPDVVVPRVGELMDMRGVDDRPRRDRQQTESRQGTSIIIHGNNVEAES